MSIGSQRLSEKRKSKGPKVLELFDQGYPYRKIASMAKVSLRDVSKFIKLAADKTRTPSTTSIHDRIIIEYRVNLLWSQVRELDLQKENLKNEVNDLRARKYNLQIQLRGKQSELDVVKRNLEYEKFSNEILRHLH